MDSGEEVSKALWYLGGLLGKRVLVAVDGRRVSLVEGILTACSPNFDDDGSPFPECTVLGDDGREWHAHALHVFASVE